MDYPPLTQAQRDLYLPKGEAVYDSEDEAELARVGLTKPAPVQHTPRTPLAGKGTGGTTPGSSKGKARTNASSASPSKATPLTPKRVLNSPINRRAGTPVSRLANTAPILVGPADDPDIIEVSFSPRGTPSGKTNTGPKHKAKAKVIEISDGDTDVDSDSDLEVQSVAAVRGSFSVLDISQFDGDSSDAEMSEAQPPAKPSTRRIGDYYSPYEYNSDTESDASETASWAPPSRPLTPDPRAIVDQYYEYWDRARERKIPPEQAAKMSLEDLDKETVRNALMDQVERVYTFFNTRAFKNKLPQLEDMIFTWSKQLTATAGLATYTRAAGKKGIAEIKLSVKILDRQDKVRLTLAHEMCHLATWIIDERLTPDHGKLFWKWAKRVHTVDRETRITECHDYNINHPWKYVCRNCKAFVGRWTKSLNLNEACKKCHKVAMELVGTPDPFDHRITTKPVAVGTASSRHAKLKARPKAGKAHSSPASSPAKGKRPAAASGSPKKAKSTPELPIVEDKAEGDSEVEIVYHVAAAIADGFKTFTGDDGADTSIDELVEQFGDIVLTTKPCKHAD
ncbi:SprT-like domain-containing protein [Mycena chlorophos]|uniref:SprT-like domain-containing protein n=1 Tax=Mycena chlorophos TaxID=658473 RepID=A0A8H6WD67_MYCCL|nr:SprT-like domain-containing protein [Mycena chlorophos]